MQDGKKLSKYRVKVFNSVIKMLFRQGLTVYLRLAKIFYAEQADFELVLLAE